MKLHHYLEVNKLWEKFVQLVKNKGQIGIPIWGVGFYSGFWPEYIPLYKYNSGGCNHTPLRVVRLLPLLVVFN